MNLNFLVRKKENIDHCLREARLSISDVRWNVTDTYSQLSKIEIDPELKQRLNRAKIILDERINIIEHLIKQVDESGSEINFLLYRVNNSYIEKGQSDENDS